MRPPVAGGSSSEFSEFGTMPRALSRNSEFLIVTPLELVPDHPSALRSEITSVTTAAHGLHSPM
ncbi:MAG: hypothetical protein ACXVPP_11660 [Actinomycetota bacterium]